MSVKYQNWLRRQIANCEHELANYNIWTTSRCDELDNANTKGMKTAFEASLEESIRLSSTSESAKASHNCGLPGSQGSPKLCAKKDSCLNMPYWNNIPLWEQKFVVIKKACWECENESNYIERPTIR